MADAGAVSMIRQWGCHRSCFCWKVSSRLLEVPRTSLAVASLFFELSFSLGLFVVSLGGSPKQIKDRMKVIILCVCSSNRFVGYQLNFWWLYCYLCIYLWEVRLPIFVPLVHHSCSQYLAILLPLAHHSCSQQWLFVVPASPLVGASVPCTLWSVQH